MSRLSRQNDRRIGAVLPFRGGRPSCPAIRQGSRLAGLTARPAWRVSRAPVGKIALCAALALPMLSACGAFQSTEAEDYTIDRKDVFEFTAKPTVTRDGDALTIRFGSRDYCDATIVIENKEGAIVRHLASGVLGSNAPEPFRKNSLEQAVVWDSKNDNGEYVDDFSDLRVRVSLGLKPRFEKTLYWHPKKLTARRRHPRAVAQPEGVYVY